MWLIGRKRPKVRKVEGRKRRFLNCKGNAAHQIAVRKKLNKSIDGLKFDETFLTEYSVKFRHRFVKFRHVNNFLKFVVDSGVGWCYNPRHSKHESTACRHSAASSTPPKASNPPSAESGLKNSATEDGFWYNTKKFLRVKVQYDIIARLLD